MRWLALLSLVPLVVGHDALAKPAKKRPKRPRTVQDQDFASAKSAMYGALSSADCLAELGKRKIAFKREAEARGVLTPVRLSGPLGGVTYRTELPPSQRPTSPYEVLDCRLVLALSDLSEQLVKRDIEEVIMFSMWRPPPKSWPKGKAATRHPGGLAIDIRAFIKKRTGKDKPVDLVVERDFPPAPNQDACEKGARAKGSAAEQALRGIFCDAKEARLFTSMLSPNYDHAHRNHFHFEITPNVSWRLAL